MNSKYLLTLLLLTACYGVSAAITNPFEGPKSKITFHLVTDDGKPCEKMPFLMGSVDPAPTGSKYNTITGVTDANGLVTLEIPSVFGVISYAEQGVAGYYTTGGKYQLSKPVDNKWQPWNPTVDVIVKPILNPIPMYARNINIDISAKNTPVGFDLEVSDWVTPYGKGTVSDFIFTMTEKVPFVNYNQPFDLTWTLSFSNKGDGLQAASRPVGQGSRLLLSRYAPENGYDPSLVQELARGENKTLNGAVGEDQNYFFRVRTVLDESGKVKSALYGKIVGPIQCWGDSKIHMIYYLNPTPNDRNMEFDPSKNLFQNLPMMQQVKAP